MENQRFPTIPHSLWAAYLLLLPVRAERVLFSLMRLRRKQREATPLVLRQAHASVAVLIFYFLSHIKKA